MTSNRPFLPPCQSGLVRDEIADLSLTSTPITVGCRCMDRSGVEVLMGDVKKEDTTTEKGTVLYRVLNTTENCIRGEGVAQYVCAILSEMRW